MNLTPEFRVINLYQCDNGFRTDSRVFDYPYILYVHSGKGFFIISDTKYKASMGDIFFCPSFIPNTIIADEETPFLLSGIEFTVNEETAGKIGRHLNILTNDFLVKCIQEMIQEYLYGKMFSLEICNNLLNVLLNSMIRLTNTTVLNPNIQAQLLEYIISNIHRTVTHNELSKVFSYHKNSINRYIINETGLSLKKYQIALRLKKASELLEYSSKPIYKISEICGYNSPVFFSNQFKYKMGITPIEFRKLKQKNK